MRAMDCLAGWPAGWSGLQEPPLVDEAQIAPRDLELQLLRAVGLREHLAARLYSQRQVRPFFSSLRRDWIALALALNAPAKR